MAVKVKSFGSRELSVESAPDYATIEMRGTAGMPGPRSLNNTATCGTRGTQIAIIYRTVDLRIKCAL